MRAWCVSRESGWARSLRWQRRWTGQLHCRRGNEMTEAMEAVLGATVLHDGGGGGRSAGMRALCATVDLSAGGWQISATGL